MRAVDSNDTPAADDARDGPDASAGPAGDDSGDRKNAGEAANLKLFRRALDEGQEWVLAMIDAMSRWSAPEGIHRGRRESYFIAGEAFDWPLLAQRLCTEVGGLIPGSEREDLLLRGLLPGRLGDQSIGDLMKEGLGVEKYRGYLNFYYGVTVEEAILHAVEDEVRKGNLARGARYRTDETDEAFERLYGARRDDLIVEFRAATIRSCRRAPGRSDSRVRGRDRREGRSGNLPQAGTRTDLLAVRLQGEELGQGEGSLGHQEGP